MLDRRENKRGRLQPLQPSPFYISHFTFFILHHASHATRGSHSSQRCRQDRHHHLNDGSPKIFILHDQDPLCPSDISPMEGESRPACRAFCFLGVNTWFWFSLIPVWFLIRHTPNGSLPLYGGGSGRGSFSLHPGRPPTCRHHRCCCHQCSRHHRCSRHLRSQGLPRCPHRWRSHASLPCPCGRSR